MVMYSSNVWPVKIQLSDGSTRIVNSAAELPKGVSFSIIESGEKLKTVSPEQEKPNNG